MKKIVLSVFALFGFAVFATAQTVTVADVEALPGQTVSAVLELEAPADTYTGVQFALQFPATGFSVAATGAASGWVGSIEYNTVADKVKFAAAGSKAFTEAAIAVEFTVDGSLALNEYDVTVTDIVFEGTGGTTNVGDVTFKVIVTDRMTLDEASTVAPVVASGVNVKVKRTIKAGEWSTICLPFAMTKTKFQNAFGSDAELKEYKGYTTTMDWDTYTPTAIVLNFDDFVWTNALTRTVSGTPYLIKTTKDIESFDVDNVTISTELNDVTAGDNNGFSGKFKGVIAKTTVPDKGLFISGNKFYYSTGATKIKAFRGWFSLEAIYNVPFDIDAPVFFSFDNETTGIENIQRTAGDDRYYNLNGQHVEKLKKGQIYIKNNKKVVVK